MTTKLLEKNLFQYFFGSNGNEKYISENLQAGCKPGLFLIQKQIFCAHTLPDFPLDDPLPET